MKFSWVWWTANKYTFKIKPILNLTLKYIEDKDAWFDPFAGMYSPVSMTNDLNPEMPTKIHMEALDFCSSLKYQQWDGAIFDPPYSLTQVSRSYKHIGLKFRGKENPTGGYPKVRDAIADLVKPGGIVISMGWNTCGIGIKRGFIKEEILIVSHGGYRNDTLVLVERKK